MGRIPFSGQHSLATVGRSELTIDSGLSQKKKSNRSNSESTQNWALCFGSVARTLSAVVGLFFNVDATDFSIGIRGSLCHSSTMANVTTILVTRCPSHRYLCLLDRLTYCLLSWKNHHDTAAAFQLPVFQVSSSYTWAHPANLNYHLL